VIDTFLADVATLIGTLREALAGEDVAGVRRAAHTLKSNGATLGASAFAELCRELEQAARDGRLDGAPGLVAGIEAELGSLRQALASVRPQAASAS
jgi:HPt (histidine-containing phosphotransfer) domain-containing protein